MSRYLQAKYNLTYLVIAHDLSMVRHISNRVAVMYLGILVELADRMSSMLTRCIPIPRRCYRLSRCLTR